MPSIVSEPLFWRKLGSFGTFAIWQRVDNSPVTQKKKKVLMLELRSVLLALPQYGRPLSAQHQR